MRKTSLLFAVAAALASSPALAQTSSSPRVTTSDGTMVSRGETMDNTISIFGLLGYGYYSQTGLGLGVRYQKEIVPQGLIHGASIHDEIGLEGGLDWTHYSFGGGGEFGDFSVNTFTPVIGAVWNFWLTPQIAVYPKLDLGYRFARVSYPSNFPSDFGSGNSYSELFLQGAVGGVYKIANLALRAELGSSTLRLGVGFNF